MDLKKEQMEYNLASTETSSKLKKEKNLSEKWNEVENTVKEKADANGYEIDKGVRDLIVALNVFDINTSQSCEGHTSKGFSAPWVRIEAPNEPEERFKNQNQIFEKIALKYRIPVEELKRMENHEEAYREACLECDKNEETSEFKVWEKETVKLLYLVNELLLDFYGTMSVSEDLKIKTDTDNAQDLAEGIFVIFNGGGDFRLVSEFELSENEKSDLELRIKAYRQEMMKFANFLKNKFFEEGQSYITEKRKKAQGKMDNDELENARRCLANI